MANGDLAVVPPSAHQLLIYTLCRFEICVRETNVARIVGAAGLERLLPENLAVFRFAGGRHSLQSCPARKDYVMSFHCSQD